VPANQEEVRARVFISCGQSKGSDEVTLARAIGERLRQLGFDHYIAVEEQSLSGLKENIFEQLRRSEYFIFVDFKREPLSHTSPPLYRGSLFSHQELALASFLNLPVLAFQESGVKTDDGILRFLQANATQFSDRHLLVSAIADQVQQRKWDPRWKNTIVLEQDATHADVGGARFFHISVRNCHRDQTAINCYAYLEKATKLAPLTHVPLEAVELKWTGYKHPNASIPAGHTRRFDAFLISPDLPERLKFATFSDWSEVVPRIEGEGKYELTYLVLSENFTPVRRTFVLDLHSSLNPTTLRGND
jgi:hypothetical protein